MAEGFQFTTASYPANNTEEIQAIFAFTGLIDPKRVKPDVRFFDKVPNVDGSVELVDEEQRPVGELKVQIKKIPKGTSRFDCPVELVGYSERVSSPFLLVCVDVDDRRAYWCHLSTLMPSLPRGQKTFTIHFQKGVDEIGPGFPYVSRWREICEDYQRRVSEYPRLKQIETNEIGLANLPVNDRRAFQEFIDEVNLLLDVDVRIVKHECFADTWKLGVSIHQADNIAVCYSIYTIPSGENAPILSHVPKGGGGRPKITMGGREITGILTMHLDGGPDAGVSWEWRARNHFDDPIKAARDFVFRYLQRLIREKRLPVSGRHQSAELLTLFIKNYGHTLGLGPADVYKTADLSHGLNVYFPFWYSLAHPRMMEYFRESYADMLRVNPFPSFEQIATSRPRPEHPSADEIRSRIESGEQPPSLPIRTDTFSLKSLRQAVEFLIATDVDEIRCPYRPMTKPGGLIWNCYDKTDLQQNITAMLEGAGADYSVFVKGNGFGRLESPLISGESALVFVLDSSKWESLNYSPLGECFCVPNKTRDLLPVTVIDLANEPEGCKQEGKELSLRGVRLNWLRHNKVSFDDVFDKRPVQTTLYGWLIEDLNRQFGQRLRLY